MNRVTFTGRLVADAVTRYTQDQKKICKFRFAVKRERRSDNQPDADFFNCTAFGRLAETMNKCSISKGTKLLIEGQLQNSNYTDRNGNKHEETQIIISSFEFLEKKSESSVKSKEWKDADEQAPFDQDDLPF